MNLIKKTATVLLIASLAVSLTAGCSGKDKSDATTEPLSTSAGETQPASGEDSSATDFDYSAGIDENGFWSGIKASDYVELYDYNTIEVPAEVHEISDNAVQTEINGMLESYKSSEKITNRAVEDGDSVNIDYVGSVDGKEFEGGSTSGQGADVTIGVTSYIDDFLEQLIGHKPGENFDIEVTFPEDYGNEELNGKDAVFNITINHITKETIPELTDKFVIDNLSEANGWQSIDEMKEGLRTSLRNAAVSAYLQSYMVDNSSVENIPESLIEYQQKSVIAYYEDYAAYYNLELNEFLNTYLGAASEQDFLTQNQESIEETAKFYLVLQAIAEEIDLTVTEEEVKTSLTKTISVDEYPDFQDTYGMPYLKMMVLNQRAVEHIVEKARLA
jgi:trigger factor